MKAMSVSGLSFAYPDGTDAINGVNLEVETGERVAVLGPNGAGKTSLLLLLIGVLEAQAGTIAIGGIQLDQTTLGEIRRRLGLVFQDPDDQLFMPTVEQDVGFGPANLGLKGTELKQRVIAALDAVGESALADRAPHHLSGGERRRISIATVLAMNPQILVLDEPTSNLDPAGRRELVALLAGMESTQVVVTHDLPFALELCPRAVILDEGRVVADGPTSALMTDRDLMSRHRLELPYGFDPANIPRR
jgi:cobalt/nickel transport system ATP-binding protein